MKFRYHVDILSTITERCHYTVEATSRKEADAIMLKAIEKEDYETNLHKSELIEDSLQNFQLLDNDDKPTAFLHDGEGNFITDNIEL